MARGQSLGIVLVATLCLILLFLIINELVTLCLRVRYRIIKESTSITAYDIYKDKTFWDDPMILSTAGFLLVLGGGIPMIVAYWSPDKAILNKRGPKGDLFVFLKNPVSISNSTYVGNTLRQCASNYTRGWIQPSRAPSDQPSKPDVNNDSNGQNIVPRTPARLKSFQELFPDYSSKVSAGIGPQHEDSSGPGDLLWSQCPLCTQPQDRKQVDIFNPGHLLDRSLDETKATF